MDLSLSRSHVDVRSASSAAAANTVVVLASWSSEHKIPAVVWVVVVAAGIILYGLTLRHLHKRIRRVSAAIERFTAECFEKPLEVSKAYGQLPPLNPFAEINTLESSLVRMTNLIREGKREILERERTHLNWLSFLCHDLGAPLRRVLTRIESLEFGGNAMSAQEREAVMESAHIEITQMSQLIASVNDYAQFEAKSDRSFEEIDLDNLLKYAVAVFEFDASRKSIELDLRVVPGIGKLRISEYLVRRAVENLISNAIRFTPENGLISVRAEHLDGAVRISVTDSGPGVQVDDIHRIFEVGYRGRTGLPDVGSSAGSLGLGLALVRGVAELHCGTVTGRNREEGGAEFVITLPAGEKTA